MKTQIVPTPAGFIVKVPTELVQYDKAVARAEKKVGVPIVFIGYSGDYNVLVEVQSTAARRHSARVAERRATKDLTKRDFSRLSQSVAAKRFDKINVARGEGRGSGNWNPSNKVERNLCHVACNGRICVVPDFTPKLP